ncbi:MAG: hypothetical protein JNN07_18780 [Verrucomicrobiales bacterium]|nr:hypothetical protein [Verrucomicrobiales bacterium]
MALAFRLKIVKMRVSVDDAMPLTNPGRLASRERARGECGAGDNELSAVEWQGEP